MKTTSDEIKILFSGKEYVIWSSQIFKKIFHFSFKMKNKLDEDLYQSKANKHLQLLASVAKQTKYFIHPTLKAKISVSWHVKARIQICFHPGQ